MAFKNLEPVIRVKFGRYAEDVIRHDMVIFNVTAQGSFINQILKNYYETANASIGRRLAEYKSYLSELDSSSESKSVLKNNLVKAKREELINLVDSYEKPDKETKTRSIRIQEDFFSYLIGESEENTEDDFYTDIPKYIRAIMEEYARLPFAKRELIFYKDKVDKITDAINGEYQIYIKTGNGMGFYVIPYKIMADPLDTTNYLAAFSYLPDQDKKDKVICSFRLSLIETIKREKSRSGKIQINDLNAIKRAIETRGIQFLLLDSNNCMEIIVRLTEAGKEMLNRQRYLRPVISRVDGDMYYINCSYFQAKYYFYKFGKEAEIIEPAALREEFINSYHDAYNAYI